MSGATERFYAKTPGGKKLHVIVGGTADGALTACGCITAQMVLAEYPLPPLVLCDWCRAHLDKESRGD